LKSGASIETSGNTITFPLLNTIGIISESSVTITVKADISTSAVPNKFYISSNDQTAILSRDINSFAPINPTAFPSFPLNSGTATLSGSLTLDVPAVMPSNLYAGASGIKVMEIKMSMPVAFGAGNSLAARGLTLTAKDRYGNPINFSSIFSSMKVNIASPSVSSEISYTVPAAPVFYAAFGASIGLTNTAETNVTIYGDLLSGASGSVVLYINDSSDIDVYQFNDPSRDIFIALTSGSFPAASGTGIISGSSGSIYMSAYPNPVRFGSSASISYNLPSDSTVTISIYDSMGSLVRKIISKEYRAKGGHESDKWDGRNDNGRAVAAGTYLIKITAEQNGNKSEIIKKITLIK